MKPTCPPAVDAGCREITKACADARREAARVLVMLDCGDSDSQLTADGIERARWAMVEILSSLESAEGAAGEIRGAFSATAALRKALGVKPDPPAPR